MALRSNLSSIARTPAPIETPVEADADGHEAEVATAPAASRGRLATPTVDTAKTETRGRPRLSDEEKQARAEKPKPVRKPAAKATTTTAGKSTAELRSELKAVEGEIAALKEAMAAAVARFQPRAETLRAKHAALSASIAQAILA
jgi:hypothetical protein